MNYMKKINAFFILMFILFTNSLVNINAIDTYYDDTSTAGYQQVENLDTRSFYNGILYQKNIGNIITNSGVDQVSYSMLSGNLNEDTKVVTYAYQANDNSFQRASLSSIAFDYEEKHPDRKSVV